MMEQFEIPANEWLKKEQNELNCSVEIKNGALHFTVEKTINFSINIDSDANTWMVWSDHSSIQPHLGSILEYCESSKPENIELLLEKMFKIITESIQKCSSKDDDEEDDDEDYYNYDDGEDDGIEKPNEEKPNERNDMDSESEDSEDERFFEGRTNRAACHRLMKDLRSMRRDAHRFCIEGAPRGNNLFIWDVKLTNFPTETRLGQDIKAWAEKSHREPVVYLEMQFPGDFPMNPPFVRVIRPRFKFLTGHVTIGGSICMEMLTSTGWTPTNDIEGILVQIRSEIMSDPNTRLDHDPDKEYNELEARNAFDRMVQRYGWK